MKQRTEDEWEARFGGTVQDREGNTIWPTFATVEALDPATVWSVIEGDETENMYLLPGVHAVNRIGFVVAEQPRTAAEDSSGDWDEVLWFDAEAERAARP